jgi:hypothetical protein
MHNKSVSKPLPVLEPDRGLPQVAAGAFAQA